MIFSLLGAPYDMLPGIISKILMWPTEVLADVQTGQYLAAAAGLGASYYLFGLPSTDQPLLSLAQWYAMTGAVVVGADMVLSNKSGSVVASP